MSFKKIKDDGALVSVPSVIVEEEFISKTLQIPTYLTKLGEASGDGKYETVQKYFNYGEGVMVGVCDTGISKAHVEQGEFAGRDIKAKDFTNSPSDWDDKHGHGTHVAHHITSSKIGIAPKASVRIAKVLGDNGSGNSAGIRDGIAWLVEEYKASNAKSLVINMSLGSSQNSTTIHNAIKEAVKTKGVIFFTSMGNSGGGNGAGNQPTERGGYPGRNPETLGITASDYNLKIANFSSRSVDADITGYGVSVLSCGTAINSYRRLSGTSMSSPCEAGVATLILSKMNTLTDKYPQINNKADYLSFITSEIVDLEGEGVIDESTGKDMEYGRGKLNVEKIIRKIGEIKAGDPEDPEDPEEPTDPEPPKECPPSKETRYFLTPHTKEIKLRFDRNGAEISKEERVTIWMVWHKTEKEIPNEPARLITAEELAEIGDNIIGLD